MVPDLGMLSVLRSIQAKESPIFGKEARLFPVLKIAPKDRRRDLRVARRAWKGKIRWWKKPQRQQFRLCTNASGITYLYTVVDRDLRSAASSL